MELHFFISLHFKLKVIFFKLQSLFCMLFKLLNMFHVCAFYYVYAHLNWIYITIYKYILDTWPPIRQPIHINNKCYNLNKWIALQIK